MVALTICTKWIKSYGNPGSKLPCFVMSILLSPFLSLFFFFLIRLPHTDMARVDPYTIKQGTGLDIPLRDLRIFDPSTNRSVRRQYSPEAAYFPVDTAKPHVACFSIDSNDAPGDAVLRSEVHYAIELVKFRLEKGQHTGHHTKPVQSPLPTQPLRKKLRK